MKPSTKPYPLTSIRTIRARIDTNPDFQRPAVWTTGQKQLLVDTVLREYDIPKIYWRRTGMKPDTFDVVDGQQRLRALWGFFDGEFKLPKDADDIEGFEIRGCNYESLPDELRIRFDVYPLDVVILENLDEDEVREMFIRLQNGTSLKAQEKRNAYPGNMRAFVRKLTEHPFFTRVGFANTRFNHDLVAAQLVKLELEGGPTNIKNADLNAMYKESRDFDASGDEAKAVKRKLDTFAKCFSAKTPELERYNVIALYCVLSELLAQFVFKEIEGKFHDWFIDFEAERRKQEELDEDHADAEWVTYKEKVSHSTDSVDSIRARMDFMLKHLLLRYPKLSRKDNVRGFTHQQKLSVFRRDKGVCQVRLKCKGTKVTWDDWHCDHRKAWSKGGKTIVENGQVACTPCNLSKGGND